MYCIVLVLIDICIVSLGEEEYKYEWTLISHPEGSEIGNMLGKNTATLKLTGVGTYTHSFTLGHSNLITCLTSFFWKKNPVRLQKKRKKSHLWFLTDESGFEIFCQTPKKKKRKKNMQVLRIFFVRVIQSTTGSYHCCSRASDFRRYTSHSSGYRD